MHPFMLISPSEIETAKKRVNEKQWAKDTLDRLIEKADSLEGLELPVFEKDWWQIAKEMHWSQTYPEINHHTNFAICDPLQKIRIAALVYAITGDEKYAKQIKDVLLHYTNYEFFAVHPDVGLNWSVLFMQAFQAYDIIYNTVNEADRAKIDDLFKRAMEAIKKNDEWWVRDCMGGLFNNHMAWHKLFIASYGLFYDKPDLLDYGINSNQGIRELIENGSRDDGLWFESSLNYHFTAVIPFVWFATILANSNNSFDLWNRKFANGRSLKQLLTGPLKILFPDKTLPTIGDTYGKRANLGESDIYYTVYDAYVLDEIAWILKDREELPMEALYLKNLPPKQKASNPPQAITRLWPEHGYVFLRSEENDDYWEGNGFSAFLSYELDSVHSNRDKFDLIAYGRGHHLALDVEALATVKHAFSSNVQSELNRSTICHNTIMVDMKDHAGINTKLGLVDFINGEDAKIATISDEKDRVYPGVKMMRTVAVTKNYVLDVFQVSSNEEHIYDYLFHTYDDKGFLSINGEKKPFNFGDSGPWKWLRNACKTDKDTDWTATARQGELTTRLYLLGEPNTRCITCQFPAKDDFSGTPVPMLIVRRKAKSTVFISVLQAEKELLPPINVIADDYRHGLMRVQVDCNGDISEYSIKKII